MLTHNKNDVHVQLSLFHRFYLLNLLLNSCDENDAKQHVFHCRLLVALEKAGFSSADVQSDVICLHACM